MMSRVLLIKLWLMLNPLCVADCAEGGKLDETDQLVPALEETILQTEREDTVLRSDRQGDCSQAGVSGAPCLVRLIDYFHY